MHRLERFYVEIPAVRPGSAGAYALAIALAVAATLLRLAIDPFVQGVQYITFFPAVIIATLVSGVRAGACCVAASAAAAWFFVLPPQGDIAVDDWQQLTTVLFFVVVAGTDVAFIGALRYAIKRYRELNSELERRVERRTQELAASQQALLQSQKMEALGQLSGGIAHDFNNMLAVVLAGVNLLRRRIAKATPGAGEILDEVDEAAQRATRLVKRLQAFSRNQPLSPQTVAPDALLESLHPLIARALGETIALRCAPGCGGWAIEVDPIQLESAILNVALNARDAMPAGGHFTIETAPLTVPGVAQAHDLPERLPAGDYVVLSLCDSGSGMSPEVAARAIEPFFTTKEAGKGTGLGLSQVHGFVTQSGGRMTIQSNPGLGTTVRFYLPRTAATLTAAPATESAAAPRAQADEVILVVEDEKDVRRATCRTLRELGYRVHEAGDGAEALDLLKREPAIALVLTDMVMPKMNGHELAEAVARRHPQVKVLGTTGYDRTRAQGGKADAALPILAKPFTESDLARAVRRQLDGPEGAPEPAPKISA